MPATHASPAPSSRIRCTDTIAIYEVRGLDVTSTSARTALHCSTTHGIVEILLPTGLFVGKCRGERDANGRPLGAVMVAKELRERQEQLRRELEQDAAESRAELQALREPTASVAAQRAFTPDAPAQEDAAKAEDSDRAPITFSFLNHALVSLEPLPEKRDYIARERALRAAWELFISSPEQVTVFAIAEKLGCRASWLRTMFDLYASDPAAPVLKPNGKLR
ncbi:hypothetical protein [Opitutus terrae]|uniref:Uncharacterized protein n=1 Tax=Opitutus terrae (strain DSM 11246 / JCM 15787 / PB90-1) TaxID=452637 RepID=B1ZUC5_OPITP|nr:hypothetical protein [Opitutus terrae]ACB76687.1 hypothetical protein Oter_3410 [Opitutus terrae PB90-1]